MFHLLRGRVRAGNGLSSPHVVEAQPSESPELQGAQRRAPPAADGRAESGPEPAVHAELIPERSGTGRQAQTTPEVRLQHGASAETDGVLGALPASVQRSDLDLD